jgi:hypothetical protein
LVTRDGQIDHALPRRSGAGRTDGACGIREIIQGGKATRPLGEEMTGSSIA